MNIKKLLKDGASTVLPSDKIKQNVAASLENSEPAAVYKSGGAAVAARRKPVIFIAVALALIILLAAVVLPFALKDGASPLSIHSFISIDVNPAIEIELDENDEVVGVYGINVDGAVLIYGENFSGTNRQVTSRIIDLIYRNGYFETNSTLRLLIDTEESREDQLYTYFTGIVDESLKACGVVDCTITVADEDSKEQAKQYGVSAAKYSLAMMIVQKEGGDITKLLALSFDELYKKLNSFDGQKMEEVITELSSVDGIEALSHTLDLLERIEDALDRVDDAVHDNRQYDKLIADFNEQFASIYPQFAIDPTLSRDALKDELDRIDDLIDDEQDAVKDQLNALKKQYLGNYYKHDDDDDYDDDDDDYDRSYGN